MTGRENMKRAWRGEERVVKRQRVGVGPVLTFVKDLPTEILLRIRGMVFGPLHQGANLIRTAYRIFRRRAGVRRWFTFTPSYWHDDGLGRRQVLGVVLE